MHDTLVDYTLYVLHTFCKAIIPTHTVIMTLFSVPPPSMSVALSPSGIIYESTLLVVTCNATLPSVVDTDVSATVTWTGPNGIVNNNGRVTVDQLVSIEDNVFQSLLTFQPVDNGDIVDGTNDGGQYTCEFVISSANTFIFSGNNSISENIVVAGI